MHHEVLGDGIRQRKPQQHPNSGLGTLLCYELFDSLCCSVWLFFFVVCSYDQFLSGNYDSFNTNMYMYSTRISNIIWFFFECKGFSSRLLITMNRKSIHLTIRNLN